MEYAEGETLSAFSERKGTLKEAELKAILYPILDGLEVVHGADFLHRDIKPGNIIIRDEDNSPVLLDFGSARQAIGARSRSVTSIITPGYAPIEQYSSRGDQGPWTDIYALGGICYRALTGEVPDDATDRMRDDPLIPVSERCAGQASAGFLSAIDWALAVDEGDRPQSIAEWRAKLEEATVTTSPPGDKSSISVVTVEEASTPSAVSQDVAPELEQQGKGRGKVLLGILGVCLLLMGLGGYLWWSEKNQEAEIVRYMAQFEEALGRKYLLTAGIYVDSIRAIDSDTPVLSELEGRLSAARRQAERWRQEQAEKRRQEQARWAAEQAEKQRQKQAALLEKRRQEQARRAAEQAEKQRQEQRVGRRFRDCNECPEMVVVPSGSFTMGSLIGEEGRSNDESPQHVVRIDYRFAVGMYEVTFAEWDACVNAGGCREYVPDDEGWGRGNRPVISVSWEDAQSYVRWLSAKTGYLYGLLSESEWEYVARAGTDTRYSWGNDIGHNRANCGGCGSRWDSETAPVGSFSANAWGVHDMHGNVWEWVQDCYNVSYVGAPADGSAWVSGNCDRRVLRGGSWRFEPRYLRSAFRSWNSTGIRSSSYGFRVVRRF